MKVLLTGGTGFVGRAVTSSLLSAQVELHLTSRGPAQEGDGCNWHIADALKPGEMDSVIESVRPDIIVHLAWCVEHGRFWRDTANLDWVAATLVLAKAAARAGTKRFVGVGTCYEYEWASNGNCSEWKTPLAAHTLYDVCKDASRRVLQQYCADSRMSFAWARLFFLYGPFEPLGRLVPSIASALVARRPAETTSGRAVRDFMDVRDAGAAIATLALSEVSGPVNIASGQAVQVSSIAQKLGDLAGRPDLVRIGALPDRLDEPPRIAADIARLRDDVGFVPAISLDKGLANALEFWRTHKTAAWAGRTER